MREAEIIHGRVGMLAALGFFVQENFHPLFSGVNGPAIKQIPELPSYLWFLMALGIGIAESTRVQAQQRMTVERIRCHPCCHEAE